MRLMPLRLLLLLSLLLLTGCHSHDDVAAAGESPEAAVGQSVALLRAGDFDRFWRHALPPQDYATLRADWARARAASPPLSATDRARIDTLLHELAAPDAQATLDAQLQPWLAQAHARYADQLPLLVAIGRALANNAVSQDAALSEAQRRHAVALIEALVPWAQQAPWFDPARARETVGVLAATARRLGVHDAESLRAMDFDQAMRSYALAFAGLKQVLATYGLPVDQALASAHPVPLDYRPPYARIRLEYVLLGKPLALETTMVQEDGRWYDQDLLDSVRQAHRRLAAPAGAASALPAAPR